MGSYAGQRRQTSSVSGWIKFALVGVIISFSFQGALCEVEPTESQCRPYIEKALKEQHLELDEQIPDGELNKELLGDQEESPPTDELTDSTEGSVTNEDESKDDDNEAEIKTENEEVGEENENAKTEEEDETNEQDDGRTEEKQEEEEEGGEKDDKEIDGLEVESKEEVREEQDDTREEEEDTTEDQEDTAEEDDKASEAAAASEDEEGDDKDTTLEKPIDVEIHEVEMDSEDDGADESEQTEDKADQTEEEKEDEEEKYKDEEVEGHKEEVINVDGEEEGREKEEKEGKTEEEKKEAEENVEETEEEKGEETEEGKGEETEEGKGEETEEGKGEETGEEKSEETEEEKREETEEEEREETEEEKREETEEEKDEETEEEKGEEAETEEEKDEGTEKEEKAEGDEEEEKEDEKGDKDAIKADDEEAAKEKEGKDQEEEGGEESKDKADEEVEEIGKEEVSQSEAGGEAAGEGDQERPEEEELIKEMIIPENLRPRDHIGKILKLEDSGVETILEKTIDTTLKALKGLYDNAIKPLEMLYKYRDLSNRHFGDPEIFSKPLILFMGPWSGGKSSTINYLLDNEFSHMSLRTGAEPSPAYFNILMYGEEEEILDGTQLAADWTFSGLQKFGQGLLDRLKGVKLPNKLLEKVNIVEIPGILEIRKQVQRLFPFNDACQWFIDRADIIFLVYDPSKLDVGPETEAILDQLKGREYQTRIILNKADQVKPEELMRVQGTLIWNISPLMSSSEPPIMYSTSLWSLPYEMGAPTRLLQAQERAFLRDLREAIDKRVENKISSARRFAVRVRNHAKMVDCYLTTYYNHKSIFGNRKKISDDIIEYPQKYHIYEGLSTLTNISRYDLPDPDVYRDFFKINPLYEFKKLSETCTYFRGCPINKLDVAIAYDLPELVGKYKKVVETAKEQLQKENS